MHPDNSLPLVAAGCWGNFFWVSHVGNQTNLSGRTEFDQEQCNGRCTLITHSLLVLLVGYFFIRYITRLCIKMSGVWDLGKEIYLVDAP